MEIKCTCSTPPSNEETHIEDFLNLRSTCPALKEIFIPNHLLQEFSINIRQAPNKASHQSILFLAYKNGYLNKLTLPVHRYLLEGSNVSTLASSSYKSALQEKWFFYGNELSLHQKARGYRGKLTELQCAEWLEDNQYEIINLEALNGKHDIEAINSNLESCVFEVKFIGRDDNVFLKTHKLDASDNINTFSLYQASDFLLIKAYDAAKQFSSKISDKKHIALIVIENVSWPQFEQVVKDDWLNLDSPKFLEDNPSVSWRNFIKKLDLLDQTKLKIIPGILDELWIMSESDGFAKKLEKNYTVNAN